LKIQPTPAALPGTGFAADLEKYLEAAPAGWRVVRLGPNELTAAHVGAWLPW